MRRVVAEITWLVRLLEDLSIAPSLPVSLHSDSIVAIHIAKNPVFHERTKHVDLDCHFVRQQFLAGLISLSFVLSQSQLADIFTKPLPGPAHQHILAKLGLLSAPSNLKGGVGECANHHGELLLEKKNEESVSIVQEKQDMCIPKGT